MHQNFNRKEIEMKILTISPYILALNFFASSISYCQLGDILNKKLKENPSSSPIVEERSYFTKNPFPRNAINVKIESVDVSKAQPDDQKYARIDIKFSAFWDSTWIGTFSNYTSSKALCQSANQTPKNRINDKSCSDILNSLPKDENSGSEQNEKISIISISRNSNTWDEFKNSGTEYETIFCKNNSDHCNRSNVSEKSFVLNDENIAFKSEFKTDEKLSIDQFDENSNNAKGLLYIITKNNDGYRSILSNQSSEPMMIEGRVPFIHHFYTQISSIKNINAYSITYSDTIKNSTTITIPKKILSDLASIEIKVFSQSNPDIITTSLLYEKFPRDMPVQKQTSIDNQSNTTQTKFGSIIIGDDREVIYQKISDSHKKSAKELDTLFQADYLTTTVDTILSLPDRDIVLIGNYGGPGSGCPAMYYFVTTASNGAVTTDEFGTCNEKDRIIQNGNVISVYMAGYKGPFESNSDRRKAEKEKYLFTFKDGKISKKLIGR